MQNNLDSFSGESKTGSLDWKKPDAVKGWVHNIFILNMKPSTNFPLRLQNTGSQTLPSVLNIV